MMYAEIGSARTTSVLIDWFVWNVKPQSPVTKFFIQSTYCTTIGLSRPSSSLTALRLLGGRAGARLERDDDVRAPR